MSIREKVARAIADCQQFAWGLNYDTALEEDKEHCDEIATIAITTFLKAAAEQGWHMRPDEATDEMDTAGSGWCWHEAPPKCWRDMTEAAISAGSVVMTASLWQGPHRRFSKIHPGAHPKFEWDK